MLEYVCQYRKYFPADSWEFVWSELPICEGYAYIAGAQVFDGWIQLGESVMDGGGYIGGEVNRILNERKNNRG